MMTSPIPELQRLNVFIGRWLTEGKTVAEGSAPGGHFVMHPAYGRIGSMAVGGLEVIGFDPSTGQFQTYFFDSEGNTVRQTLSNRDRVWTWLGPHVRCRSEFSGDGRTLTAHHERSDDGEHWKSSMTVTLRKID